MLACLAIIALLKHQLASQPAQRRLTATLASESQALLLLKSHAPLAT